LTPQRAASVDFAHVMVRRHSLILLAWVLVFGALCPMAADAATHGRKSSHAVTRRRAEKRTAPHQAVQAIPTTPPTTGSSGGASAAAAASSAPPPTRGPTRIDFDDRLVTGQTNKSGSVYLYDRKELKTASMLKMRESFREEIVS